MVCIYKDMLMKIRKNNLLTITVLTSATGHHMAVFGVYTYFLFLMIPCGSDGKESACNVGDLGSIPVLGRSPGEGKVYPLQYSCLENSMNSTFCHKGGLICLSEVIDVSPSNLDFSLCFIQQGISYDVLCI